MMVLFATAITQSPIYPKSNDLHNVIFKMTVFAKHKERLLYHVDVEAIQLLDNSKLVRRLKRKLKIKKNF
jgi:hypothetical protein